MKQGKKTNRFSIHREEEGEEEEEDERKGQVIPKTPKHTVVANFKLTKYTYMSMYVCIASSHKYICNMHACP